MALTKLPIELIQGNGDANKLITNVGDSLDVGDISASPSVSITDIKYDSATGIMKITLSNDEVVNVIGFVRARDLPRGLPGRAGKSGRSGLPGINGIDGKKGDVGPRGFRGLKGNKGVPGPRGPKGPVGETGYQGARGQRGTTGSKGAAGSKGEIGETGDDGRSAILPIAVSDGDPGALGAGSLWVKPSNFKYGDPVNFTLTDNKDEFLCRDTIDMLSAMSAGDGTPDWYYTKDFDFTKRSDTYVAEYQCSCVDDNSYYIIALIDSINGKVSCLITQKSVQEYSVRFANPVCALFQSKVVIFDSNKLYVENLTLNLDAEIHNMTEYSNKLLLTSDSGLFLYNNQKLSKLLDYPCNKIVINNNKIYIGLNDKSTILLDESLEQISIYEGIPFEDSNTVVLAHLTDMLHVLSLNEVVLYSTLVTGLSEYAKISTAYYQVGVTGLKFLIDSEYDVKISDSFIIEWDKNNIFVEWRLL